MLYFFGNFSVCLFVILFEFWIEVIVQMHVLGSKKDVHVIWYMHGCLLTVIEVLKNEEGI